MSSCKDIKLLAFDLDGTLVTDDKRLTERTRRALQAASDSGIETVIATGRPITAVPEEIKGQPCFRYAVSTDGARIEDLQSGKILHQAYIPQRLVRPIYEIFDHYDGYFVGTRYMVMGRNVKPMLFAYYVLEGDKVSEILEMLIQF